MDVPVGHPAFGVAQLCECKATERQQHQLDKRLELAGVPPKYATFTFKDFRAKAALDRQKALAVLLIENYLANGWKTDEGKRGIFLYGPSGTGKTGALTPLFCYMLKQGMSGIWIGYADLMAQLRDFGSGQVEQRLEACRNAGVLMIDDLFDPAAKNVSDYARECLYRIIEFRQSHDKPMFFTSNVDPHKIEDVAHRRIARRIYDNCSVAHVGGKPFDELERTNAQ